jgi:hypothetical protein
MVGDRTVRVYSKKLSAAQGSGDLRRASTICCASPFRLYPAPVVLKRDTSPRCKLAVNRIAR